MNQPSSFPEPTILTRLEEFQAGAIENIMRRWDRICTERRQHDWDRMNAGKTASLTQAWGKALLKGFANLLNIWPAPRERILDIRKSFPDRDALAEGWASVGDSMRRAMLEYMQEHDLTPEKLGLTQVEIDSLEIPGQPPPGSAPKVS